MTEEIRYIPTTGAAFWINDWHVHPSTGKISRDDRTVKLPPQAVDVLVYLSKRSGEVVSRDELEAVIWEGRAVGYDALTGVIFKLRKALEDDQKQPRVIETISKRGYRLVGSVHAQENGAAITGQFKEQPNPHVWRWLPSATLAVIGTVVAVSASIVLWHTKIFDRYHVNGSTISDKVIAVLPFKNLGTTSDFYAFADGLTDDLITSLAKTPNLTVITRDSAFVYKEHTADLGEIAAKLGAGYLLKGSVRRNSDRLRINAQLIDTVTGRHLWTESFDGETRGLFDFQDYITRKITLALALRTGDGEGRDLGLARTQDLRAYDEFLIGRQHFYMFLNKVENEKARQHFRSALKRDPDFAMARAMLGWTHAFDAMNGWNADRSESLRLAQQMAKMALEIQAELPVAHFILGLVYRENGAYAKALVHAEKALELDPNLANAHILLATLLHYTGRMEDGIRHINTAMRLNPHHPFNYAFHLGQAYFVLGQYDAAIAALKKGISSNPSFERLHVWLAAAYAQSGNLSDASWEADQILTFNPGFTIASLKEPFSFRNETERQNFLDGLRKAGLPD